MERGLTVISCITLFIVLGCSGCSLTPSRDNDSSLSEELENRLSRDYDMPRKYRKPLDDTLSPDTFSQKAQVFFSALIEKDYASAEKVSHLNVDSLKSYQFTRIISIGEPFQLTNKKGKQYADGKWIHVPFEVEQQNGRVYRGIINMRKNEDSDEWIFDGGF